MGDERNVDVDEGQRGSNQATALPAFAFAAGREHYRGGGDIEAKRSVDYLSPNKVRREKLPIAAAIFLSCVEDWSKKRKKTPNNNDAVANEYGPCLPHPNVGCRRKHHW